MRTIQKVQEPQSLTWHRQQPHANYDNYADKDKLRQYLVAEQRGVCCYCQSRIRAIDAEGKPTNKYMKIEHWQSQTGYPARQLDFTNLLGACLGREGHPEREQHCDTRKGNSNLCFSVCDPAHLIERQIRLLGNGQITSDDAAINEALNSVLNLNWPRLTSNRRAVLDAFQQRLQHGRRIDPARELPKWDGSEPGDLPEYAQVIVYWLRKKQARATR
ncbi:MAG: TIGR02646 family protein [Pseudomonadota bacterium]|nr:TIGR02646 family protein [Pseudomonadota bacterium]MDP1904584.1 TIGR02646 family protein [Pseudomonadota bacterium]MDP2353217.1 TIGR02646 family protein [Pseudomonadota bacterium]